MILLCYRRFRSSALAQRKASRRAIVRGRRTGFTLVEMLVAVALVLLMMTLFAQVFQSVTKAMNQQKGMAENDGKARQMQIQLRGDLRNRSLSTIAPAVTGDLSTAKDGMFYLSENDPLNDGDDILHLTVSTGGANANRGVEKEPTPFYGKASLLWSPYDLNQPEADDGRIEFNTATARMQIAQNGTGSSDKAEVIWFLRGSTLYRRVLLLRRSYTNPTGSAEPTSNPPAQSFSALYSTGYPNSFLNDFDYSASNASGSFGFNESASAGATHRISTPQYRFGFDPITGMPREYGNPFNPSQFYIGRMTHRETSDSNFGYPGRLQDVNGDSTDESYLRFPNSSTDATFRLGTYEDRVSRLPGGDSTFGTADDVPFDGPRRGEDVVLTNVQAFDIKVWDDGLGEFADLGHNKSGGIYHFNQRLNPWYGPRKLDPWPAPSPNQPDNRVYDTWCYRDVPVTTRNEVAPFLPFRYTAPYEPAIPAGATVNDTPNPAPNSTRSPRWQMGTSYSANPASIVMRTVATDNGFAPLVYKVISIVDNDPIPPASVPAANSGATEPIWPTTEGATITDYNATDNTVITWQAVKNSVLPLRAIQITIRYTDVSSGQLRQVTMQHSLVD